MKKQPQIPPTPIIVLPTDTDAKIVTAAKRAGYLPILTDAPEKIRIVFPDSEVGGGTLLMAAMHGLMADYDDKSRTAFVTELHRRMIAKEPTNP